MSYIPLHVHSQYSILDSTLKIKDLVKKAKEYEMSSIALTDSGNLYGIVEFFKACKFENIKPIIGCEIRYTNQSRLEKKKTIGVPHSFPMVFLVKNEIGYKNLCKLSSLAFIEGFYYYPRIDKELLEKYHEGLICLSGPINSYISYLALENQTAELEKEILFLQKLFKEDFYFEIQRHPFLDVDREIFEKEAWVLQKAENHVKKQEKFIDIIKNYSNKFNIKCIATNDIHYLNKEDHKGHEILLNIQSGEACEIWERDLSGNPKFRIPNPKRKTYPTREFYFKSPEEMNALYSDMPEALENTKEIAEKCNFSLNFKTKHYPVYYPKEIQEKKEITKKERKQIVDKYLFDLCFKNIEKRYPKKALEYIKQKNPEKNPMDIVKERLNSEFEIISSKGLSDYFLIVYDFISWAKKRNIAVGPGRGSAAGSIMSYLLEITDLDPLRFDLFFERFINPERMSYPDIDVDICMEKRQDVIDYTISKYGKEKVAQIITFGTMKAKMAIKDVGRVLSVPLSKVNAIAKLVPEDVNMTLDKALNIDQELKAMYGSDNDAKMIIDIAKKVEGSIRNTSTHAAGIIISADELTENIPICFAKDSDMYVTQFAMKPVESVGMLKIDFLGLKTLTSIQKAVELIEKNRNVKIDWSTLPLDDKKTFDLLNKGYTLGVFQLESSGMQDLTRQLQIDKFEEIIAVGALYRPGPMDMIPSFVNRKHKKEKIEIDHPLMQSILEETYGVMVYQEQVMQIASTLAKYSLGEGDVLRRAMGKKDKKEMARQREKFIEGCKENDISEKIATTIFDKIEKFASYGFNKSHAAAYAYVSYVTAYFKANYPKEWMAALMTCDKDDISKVSKFIREAKSMRIDILPPDVNEADIEFMPVNTGIRFAMSAVKGIGEGVVEAVVSQRKEGGSYSSLYDFIKRIDKTKVGKKNIETLIDAGALDFTKWSRDAMKENLDIMYDKALKDQKEKDKGIMSFLPLIEENEDEFSTPPEVSNFRSKIELLQKEKELLGFFLTSHPMEMYKEIIKKIGCISFDNLTKQKDVFICKLAFIIDSVKIRISQRTQKKFAILIISDGIDKFEMPIWPELFERASHLIEENKLIYGILKVENTETFRISALWVEDLTKLTEDLIKQSDEVFTRAKDKLAYFPNKKKFKKETKDEKEKALTLIHVDLDKISLSKIIQLKNLLLNGGGKIPIEIDFYSEEKKVSKVILDNSWGVDGSEKTKKNIMQVFGIKDVEYL